MAFTGTSWKLAKKLDPALLSLPDSVRGSGYTYAFLILNERQSDAAEAQLKEIDAQTLGPHSSVLKIPVPTGPARLMAPGVKEMG